MRKSRWLGRRKESENALPFTASLRLVALVGTAILARGMAVTRRDPFLISYYSDAHMDIHTSACMPILLHVVRALARPVLESESGDHL